MTEEGVIEVVNKLITFIGLFLVLVSSAHAESWQVVRAAPNTGTKWVATVKNSAGDRLSIWRKINGFNYEAYAKLELAKHEFDDTMPLYRIDNGPVEDTLVIKLAGQNLDLEWGHVSGRVAQWRVWSSTEPELRKDDSLRPWLTGRKITITYTDASGKRRKTSFSLKGSAKAIKKAITGPFM